jgi:hypothetical protein
MLREYEKMIKIEQGFKSGFKLIPLGYIIQNHTLF